MGQLLTIYKYGAGVGIPQTSELWRDREEKTPHTGTEGNLYCCAERGISEGEEGIDLPAYKKLAKKFRNNES